MKNPTYLLISLLLLSSTVACQDAAKTTVSAPNPGQSPETPNAQITQSAKEDAQSETRRKQLNSDIRSREQRNNTAGGGTQRANTDLASEVRGKLEANIPNGQLTVNADNNGTILVSGTVNNQEQLAKIEPLSKEIKGVKNVVVKAIVAPPKN